MMKMMENVFQPSAKMFLILLGLTVAASAADPGIHLKDYWFCSNNVNNMEQRNSRYYKNS